LAGDELRRPPLIAALALFALCVALELGATAFLRTASLPASALDSMSGVPASQIPALKDSLNSAASQGKPPGIGIPYLALVDGIVTYSLALMVLSLLVSPNAQAKLQGAVSLIASLLLLIGSIVLIFLAFFKLLLMVTLFFATPFGTIAYLAIWGAFPKGGAAVVLSLLMVFKIAAVIALVLAQQRFLRVKSLVLLLLTSLLATLIVSFLHGIVPGPLVSITDAIAAIIVAILAAIWAIVILIGSIPAVLAALATR
jgi:hypothetical protein